MSNRHDRQRASSYCSSVVDWHPDRPTVPQVVFGFFVLCAVAALSLYWSADQVGGNRVFLWFIAAVCALLAASRLVVAVILIRESQARRH